MAELSQHLFNVPVWFSNALAICFGLVVGSFLNVVVGRLPEKKSIIKPPSHCPKCLTPIKWYDNVPVLGWLWLGGKCRSCKTPISVRYAVIELLTALLFLTAKLKFGWEPMLIIRDWPWISLLIAITFIDLEHRIIPDELSLGGLCLGLLTAHWVPGLGLIQSMAGAAIGFGVFYGIAWFYQWRTGSSGLGGGDIKLLAMLGAFLGPFGVLATILISSLAGSVIGIAWAMITRQKSVMKVSIPYGPFLVIGGLYYYLLGDGLWSLFTIPT
ncbi:MAG: prepilin peptidase [Methylotenera sp.]|nr:prepilin peptidase [Oligoflexia bacterium]